MPQTNQNKVGILLPNSYTPVFDSFYAAGNRGGIQLGAGPTLHVAKTGNDSTGSGSIGSPYLTINKAMSVATEGCTIQIHANAAAQTTYFESTATSPWVDEQFYFGAPLAIGVLLSGTSSNRCTMMAYPGDEGLVTIDGGGTQAGIKLDHRDYWNFYGLRVRNCQDGGICNTGLTTQVVPVLEDLSVGVHIENCFIENTNGLFGGNISGISPWGSKDWVIRNCFIKSVDAGGATVASAIQSYGAINLLIEHCETDDVEYGFWLKDNFLVSEDPRITQEGAEVRYCKLNTRDASIYISIRGEGSVEAGDQYIHHNLMYGNTVDSRGVVHVNMRSAASQSKKFRLENNTMDIQSLADAQILVSSFDQCEFVGNIVCGGQTSIYSMYDDTPEHLTRITQCDRNIYTDFKAVLNLYGASSTTFNTLPAWNAATAGTPPHLAVSNPDSNSIETSASTLFTDRVGNVYTLAGASPAIGFMADGSNAGAYQYGTEIIGLLPSYSAGY